MADQVNIGLDFGSTSVKVVALAKGTPIKVMTAASAPLPAGTLFSDLEADQNVVAETTKKLLSDNHISETHCVVALPESQVFTRVVEVPQMSDDEVKAALRWQAEQYIPLPLSEVSMDFSILTKPRSEKDAMKVLLVAAPLTIINKQINLLSKMGLTARALETELISAARVFTRFTRTTGTVMIVDASAATTGVVIAYNGVVMFTHSLAFGGETITRAIAESFHFHPTQANEFKKAYGLVESALDGKVYQVVRPIVDTLIEELKKVQVYYKDKHGGLPIDLIILSGGMALLPGLIPYMANAMGVEVQIGNPWSSFDTSHLQNQESLANSPIYTVATGLALRNMVS